MPRDTIVLGASAGGVEALIRVLDRMPADLPASVIVVQHMAAHAERLLVGLLDRRTELAVQWAEQGDRLEHGKVYVAPPAVHAMIVDSHLQLMSGPRENHVRPSIDRLLRSAAATRGPRTIGVLLTGMLDDGVAGLRALQQAGGATIVQDPVDAAYPDMPRHALAALRPDAVLGADAIGPALVRWTGDDAPAVEPPAKVASEAALDRETLAEPGELAKLGPQTTIPCPDCGGPLWDVGDREQRRYRCYLGHTATAARVLSAGSDAVESAMWTAIRALHDRATTFEELARDAERNGNPNSQALFREQGEQAREKVKLARQFMAELTRE